MTEQIITYLKFGNRFYGIELAQSGDREIFYGISLKKQKKQLDIELNFVSNDLAELKTHIPKDKALTLVINTKSVLTKKIQSKTSESLKLVYTAFPNIKVEDFYYETLSLGNNHFVSICRKSYIENLLNTYSSNGLTIIDFSLGNLVSSIITDFIELDTVKTSNATISIDDKNIIDISLNKSETESFHNINGLEIESRHILSFASALNLVLNTKQLTQSSFIATKEQLYTAFNQKRFAKQFLKSGLSFLFIILLINFLFFNHYYNEVNSLRETTMVLENSKTKMISLSEKVQKTEKMVSDVLKSSASRSSFYVNEITNDIPEHILLNEINYQPLVKRIKEDKPIENQQLVILVFGETQKRILFSKWISQLELKPWIYSVNILSFEDSDRIKSNFKIKIQMNVPEK